MKKAILFLMFLCATVLAFAQRDVQGCKDSPLYPDRMLNYYISECKAYYGEADFNLSSDADKMEHKEGYITVIRYDFNKESKQDKLSTSQILKHYSYPRFDQKSGHIGDHSLYTNPSAATGTCKIIRDEKESAWMKIECGGSNNNEFYILTILQLEEMKQDVTADDILTALNTDGHIALYINFETGKSDIKSESKNIIDRIADMLKKNASLKVSIEGHTDNTGNATSNQMLSEHRAQSVMNALVAKGIDKIRLAAKGRGQTKPIADNKTEDGKAKNRRVEIVKM